MLTHTKEPPAYFSYLPTTGEFTEAGVCDLSPARYPRGHELEGHLIEPDVPIVPAHATLVHPPKLRENEAAIWDGKMWEIVADHRGEVRWGDGGFHEIIALGDPPYPPITIKDAQYVVDDGDTDAQGGGIKVWINDDVITIADKPSLVRDIVAAWEATGETIRPVEFNRRNFVTEETFNKRVAEVNAEAEDAMYRDLAEQLKKRGLLDNSAA